MKEQQGIHLVPEAGLQLELAGVSREDDFRAARRLHLHDVVNLL